MLGILAGTMKRTFVVISIFLALASMCFAQQNPADAHATKEDVERNFAAMHTRDLMKNVLDLMGKQMHQMVHEQVKKEPGLPPDFEERMNKNTDEMIKNFPIEDMFQVMIPVYEHHLTKGDIDALVSFYSSPAGQKYLQELPAIQTEGMQGAMGVAQKFVAKATDQVREEIAQQLKALGADVSKKSQTN